MVVTSGFGMRMHPVLHSYKMHSGWDLKADYEPVYAIAGGVIEQAAYDNVSGNYIVVRHTENITSIYAHLSEISISVSQNVNAGDIIGISGNTGRSTGTHLHFEIKFKGKTVDPEWFLKWVDKAD